jgi:hypothetical protein
MNKVALGIILSLSLGSIACSGDEDSCAQLAKKLCDGEDEAYCKKAQAWLDKEMVGPDGKKLDKKKAATGCSLIMGDDAVTQAYVAQAKKELGGEK